jgi:hypothetical protein
VTSPLEASGSNLGHLMSMADEHGVFEHALFSASRPEHGYCSDDMARVLVVTSREQGTPEADYLAKLSVKFLDDALNSVGRCRNRMNRSGRWQDVATLDDCWGRAIWGLGTAASRTDDHRVRGLALAAIERAMRQRSPWPRSMAFATLGAADLLKADPDNVSARSLLSDAADTMAWSSSHAGWPWPEPRLTYANATLPEAMIAAGWGLDRPALVRHGLELLEWLLGHETYHGHLSVTPVGGAAPEDEVPGFDQQPIEIAALAEACARALDIDGNRLWADGITSATNWFLGDNDGEVPMWDPETGGGFDGLQRSGVNLNQGTESTLAFLSTMQHARRLSDALR